MENDLLDTMPFDFEEKSNIIKVLGVGGGGGNAVNHMFDYGIRDVDFIVANTDAQALKRSPVPVKVQLGATLTQGLGAGNKPEHGKEAAIESIDEIKETLGDSSTTKMVFVTAGMGGGTGTGAAPVIAKVAHDLGILTVGIVTIPFRYEGPKRVNQALAGLEEMTKSVDALLIIDNEKIREIYGKLSSKEAFSRADDVLTIAAKSIAEIITTPGYINVDFADVRTVMQNSGVALMGSASDKGEGAAIKAIENALTSPLLNNNDITGAKNLLVNIATNSNCELSLEDLTACNVYVQNLAGNEADLIWGQTFDDSLEDGEVSVTVIATGFPSRQIIEPYKIEGEKNSLPDNLKKREPAKKSSEQIESAFSSDARSLNGEVTDSPDAQSHSAGSIVEFDVTETDDKSDFSETESEPVIVCPKFQKINFTEREIDAYESTPAYIRRGIQLSVNSSLKDSKFQRLALEE